jgi:RimJ/RimL family protein N-acetyltransferase
MRVRLEPISAAAAAAMLAGEVPPGVKVADGYPTEFSQGMGQQGGTSSPLGPYFIVRADDSAVVGEIGGAFTAPGVVEIGYAIVEPCWGRGYATEAVQSLLEHAKGLEGLDHVVAHSPLERPASGRVLEKAGFVSEGETDDEHDGVTIRVRRWVARP